jgi:hypothetical protein
MKANATLKHEFVEFIPEDLEQGTLYISIRYKTGTHLCCCGCGNIVVTPISPTDWKITFDGKTVTLHPSIGNWSFRCQSHYWIRNNRVEWAPKWSREQIERGRLRDGHAKEDYFAATTITANEANPDRGDSNEVQPKNGFWQRLTKWFS